MISSVGRPLNVGATTTFGLAGEEERASKEGQHVLSQYTVPGFLISDFKFKMQLWEITKNDYRTPFQTQVTSLAKAPTLIVFHR